MIRNLCFHGIGTPTREREPGESRYWVTRDTFLGILDVVVPHPNVRLSFDDGNHSDIAIALPALRERGLTATFFPLAGRLDDPASLSPADLRELRAAGMTIGSHGWEHVPWAGLAASDAERELVAARTVLADVSGGPIDRAALPLGRYDRVALGRAKAVGYHAVFTSDRFPARPDAWLQARFSVTTADTPATIAALLGRRPAVGDGVNLAKCLIKRLL